MISSPQDRPEGAPPTGVSVVHADLGIIGTIAKYWPPGTFYPPKPESTRERQNAPVEAWCVELSTGDVVLWRPGSLAPLGPKELELLGAVAAGTEALFKSAFERAKKIGVPLPKAVELVLIAFKSQVAAIARHLPHAPSAPTPPVADPPADPPSE